MDEDAVHVGQPAFDVVAVCHAPSLWAEGDIGGADVGDGGDVTGKRLDGSR